MTAVRSGLWLPSVIPVDTIGDMCCSLRPSSRDWLRADVSDSSQLLCVDWRYLL